MALLLTLILSSLSCSGIDVSSEHPDGDRHETYKSYLWLPASEPGDLSRTQEVSRIVLDTIERAIHDELQAKGLVRVSSQDAGKADLFVTSTISITKNMRLNDPYYSFDRVRIVESGTLMIDLIDSKTKKLVWSGRGQTRIGSYPTMKQRQTRARQVVHAILAQYRPNS